MPSLLRRIYESVADSLGVPTRIAYAVEERPSMYFQFDALPQTACYRTTAVRWGEWYNENELIFISRSKTIVRGWHYIAGYGYSGTSIDIPELSQLVECEITENWSCDIRDVDGLSNSKSPIEKVHGMDDFAERYCSNLIEEISEESLQKSLAHKGIRIIHGNGSDYFTYCGWDRRIFLINSDGSHHFAAARYIAKKLNRSFTLKGKLYKNTLNSKAVGALLCKFEIFALKEGSVYSELFEPLKEFRATFFTLDLPKPYEGGTAIFLPRSERRSRKVAEVLRNAKFYDLGAHLIESVRQS